MKTLLHTPFSRALIAYSFIVFLACVIAFLIKPMLLHVIMAVALYILLQPVSGLLIRSGVKDSWAALFVLAALVIVSTITTVLILPMLIEQFSQLQSQIPTIIESFNTLADKVSQYLSRNLNIELSTDILTQPIIDSASAWSKNALVEISNLAVSLVGLAVIVPLLAYFLLRDYRTLRNHLMQWLPNRNFELGWIIYYRVARQLQDYVRGVMLQSGIMALITTTGFALLGIELAALLGILTGLLNVIPYVGPLLAMIPPCVVIMGSGSLELSLIGGAVGVILFAQLMDNVVTVPMVIANAVNLHPLTVIMGVVIFGHFFGFFGMVVAIPALATSKILFSGLIQGLRGSSDEDDWAQPG